MESLIRLTRIGSIAITIAFICVFLRLATDFTPSSTALHIWLDLVFIASCLGYIIAFVLDVVAYGRVKDPRKRHRSAARWVLQVVCLAFLAVSILSSLAHINATTQARDTFTLVWFAFLAINAWIVYNDYVTASQQP